MILSTEGYAAKIGGGSTSTPTKYCTVERAKLLGCSVIGFYNVLNQIVPEVDLEKLIDNSIHFNLEDVGNNRILVLNGNIPTTDFWPTYYGGALMSAGDAYLKLLDSIDKSFYDDSLFANTYFPQDYTFEEWRDSDWCGTAWQWTGGTYVNYNIRNTNWYSFVSIIDKKMYSVSSTFQFTPGTKRLNWDEYKYG